MDISAEIAAIQAASQGSELRQPLVGALNKLNSGSLPAVTASDAGKILKVGTNGWEAGEKSGYMPVPTDTMQITDNGTYNVTNYASASVHVSSGGSAVLVPKTITQNGTYDPADDNANGYNSVIVNVSPNWNDPLCINWDFSNPVNTRGQSSYQNSGMIYTLDGWQLQGGKLTLASNGVKLERYASDAMGFFMQRFKNVATSPMLNTALTLSVIIDEILYSISGQISATAASYLRMDLSDSITVRVYYYGSSGEIALTIDINNSDYEHIYKAIKLETGSQQTLATQINGAWVLNNIMNSNTEYIRARNGVIYNS